MAHYVVTVERTVAQWMDVEVDADSKADARVQAIESAKAALDCEWDTIPGSEDDHEVTETAWAG